MVVFYLFHTLMCISYIWSLLINHTTMIGKICQIYAKEGYSNLKKKYIRKMLILVKLEIGN